MMDKDYTHCKKNVDFNLFTFDLVTPPGFENAKLFKNAFRNINRKNKIKKIFNIIL